MAPGTQKSAAAKFYQEDIIQRIDDPKTYGVVLRCWQDVEDLPSLADHVDPLMRPLVQGEVGVSYFPRPVREIISEDKLALVDRLYQPGDLLKRSVDDVHSGIVTGVNVRARLNHAISGEAIPGWKIMDDIEAAVEVDIGDYVVYNDWVGQVVEMFDEAWVEVSGGNVIRLPELSARLAIGEKGPDILPQPTSVQGIFGFLLGSTGPSSADTVVSVKHTVLAVAWLAVNQSLPPDEAQARPRPQRYWHGNDLGKLTIVSRRAEEAMRVGNRVRLRDGTGVPVTRHGKLTEPQNIVEVDTLIIQETKTIVEVLWQDGSRETLDARETVPYLNPDEYDCWPGDHVVWKTEDSKQHVVVQSVNAQDRTARVRVVATGALELASVLELDAHGSNDWSAVNPGNDGLGVRRGDLAFIHREGTANGAVPPTVPKIGEVEEWVRETPTVGANGQLGGWRRHMADIGTRIAEERGKEQHGEEPPIQRPQKDDTSLNWFGEVIGLRLDGTVEVMLPNSQILNVTLNRLTRLYDSVEQLEDLWGDDEGTVDEGEEVEVWEMDEDGRWVEGDAADDDEWEDEEMADAVDESAGGEWSPSTDTVIPPLHVETPMVVDSAIPLDGSRPTSSSGRPHSPDVPKDATDMDEEAVEEIETPWKRFEILSTAPSDHAFYNNAPAQPSRNFMTRLTKEYKALQSSLPDSILVRAYEDRADLLRSLIIGPENTPYEDAPFVIDWMLDSNFPQTPPIAHFLSWTNGNGRVNPNLYEEGKVCLSILGTWAGDKSESWSAARSSLLQAFVSIQGLVLVKEPWFCEPAYEKLRGTKDGIVNSRLYNEKAYVLSRGFIRKALELRLGGLEAELDWFYYTNGKLRKALGDARALVEKSKASKAETEADSELAVPRLSEGGIIALERTLAKLQGLLDTQKGLQG